MPAGTQLRTNAATLDAVAHAEGFATVWLPPMLRYEEQFAERRRSSSGRNARSHRRESSSDAAGGHSGESSRGSDSGAGANGAGAAGEWALAQSVLRSDEQAQSSAAVSKQRAAGSRGAAVVEGDVSPLPAQALAQLMADMEEGLAPFLP